MPLDHPQRLLLLELRKLRARHHRQRKPDEFTDGMRRVLARLESLEVDRPAE